METLFSEEARRKLVERLDRLTPGSRPLWGRMNAGQMMVHTRQQMDCALGTLPLKPIPGPYGFRPLWWMIIYVMPWPKGAPTAPELEDPATGDWSEDKAKLLAAMEEFGRRDPKAKWGFHPMFGYLPGKHWGALAWRHTDHHFRQFGL